MCNPALIKAAHKHLGRPWNANGFDCWECVRAIYWDAFQITLPSYGEHQEPSRARRTILDEATSGRWQEIESPTDGCMVLLGKREWPHHIGVYMETNGGMIVHCLDHVGCAIDSMRSLRAIGWGYMKFYTMSAAQ